VPAAEPSPKFQLKVNGDVPPVTVAVKDTGTPISDGDGVTVVMVTARPAVTTIEWVAVALLLTPSVAVNVTVNVPAADACVAGLPEPAGEPSPKFQLKLNGLVPPVVVAVNVTDWPEVGLAGLKVKSTTGVALTVIDTEADAVTARLSVAVTVAVNVPAAAYL
jgi:hypothetical protein